MKVYFLSRQVERRPGLWVPSIEQIRESGTGTFPCVWIPTSDNRPARWCVGYADVTAAQLTALESATGIIVMTEAEAAARVNQFPRRALLDQFCDQVGVTRPAANVALLTALSQFVSTIRPGSTLDLLLGRLTRDFGV